MVFYNGMDIFRVLMVVDTVIMFNCLPLFPLLSQIHSYMELASQRYSMRIKIAALFKNLKLKHLIYGMDSLSHNYGRWNMRYKFIKER